METNKFFKRKGIVQFSMALLKTLSEGEYKTIFNDFYVIDVLDHPYIHDAKNFVGLSSQFDEVEPGQAMPVYEFTITRHVDGKITKEVERLKSTFA